MLPSPELVWKLIFFPTHPTGQNSPKKYSHVIAFGVKQLFINCFFNYSAIFVAIPTNMPVTRSTKQDSLFLLSERMTAGGTPGEDIYRCKTN
jgi:hypothetical protein